MFGDAGGEEYGQKVSKRIGWLSECVAENDYGRFPTTKLMQEVQDQLKREVIVGLKEENGREVVAICSVPEVV